MQEEELIRECQTGNLNAFEELLTNYEGLIYNLVFRYFGNYDDANDLGQEVLIRVYQKIGEFKGKSSFKTWLYRVVCNLCLDELRRRKRKFVSLETLQEQGIEPAAQTNDPALLSEGYERVRMVQEILSLIPVDHKTVLILRDLEGLEYQEIAQILGCNIGTVKSRLSRARESFRKIATSKPRYGHFFEGSVSNELF